MDRADLRLLRRPSERDVDFSGEPRPFRTGTIQPGAMSSLDYGPENARKAR